MFEVGDKVMLVKPSEVPDWDKLRDETKQVYLQMSNKILTITKKITNIDGDDIYKLDGFRYYVRERILTYAANRETVSLEEFDNIFVN